MASRLHRFVLGAIMSCLYAGCAHSPPGEAWGEAATFSPGWTALKAAALEAATDPYTWGPATAAATLQIGNLDEELADDARREGWLFGSPEAAADASDWLRAGTIGVYVGLGLAAPGPGDPAKRTRANSGGLLVGAAALGGTWGLTSGLKSATKRTRPDGTDDRSLPSSHASSATAAARLASETLAYYDLTPRRRFAARTGLAALAGATAWARVEAGKHYPSDVLLGAALGNFIAKFATRAFLRPEPGQRIIMDARLLPDGGALLLHAVF